MTLSLLLLLVTGGIAGIVIILHLLGLSRPCVFTDEPAVRRVWQAEYPDTQILSIVQSRNRHFALVDSRAGLGIVWPMGAGQSERAAQDRASAQRGTSAPSISKMTSHLGGVD